MRALNNDIFAQLGKEYGADGVEISAHALCAEDHLPYQGRQFSRKEFERIQNSLDRPFGMWNCKHTIFPIILGISAPAYDESELARYQSNSSQAVTIDGRTMSRYQWSQEQRRIETAVRAQKDIAIAAKAAGDDATRRAAQAKINELQERYAFVSEKAGLNTEYERMTVAGFRSVKTVEQLKNPFSSLKNMISDGILVTTERYTGHHSLKPQSDTPNATIDVVGKKGGVSRYIYGADMRILYRVDNNDHGNPSEHPFKNGEHYHIAVWEGSKFIKYLDAAEIP